MRTNAREHFATLAAWRELFATVRAIRASLLLACLLALLGLTLAAGCAGAPVAPTAGPTPSGKRVVLAESAPVAAITVTNNHPFAIREPIRFPLRRVADGDTTPVWAEVALEPGESRRYTARDTQPASEAVEVTLAAHFPSGLPAAVRSGGGESLPLFDLSMVEMKDGLEDFPEHREERIRGALVAGTGALRFVEAGERRTSGMTELRYRAEGGELNRYAVELRYRVFASGIIDVDVALQTRELRDSTAYMALAKHLPMPVRSEATIRWKGALLSVPPVGASPQRTERGHGWGRDVAWVTIPGAGGAKGPALLARFTPGLTRMHRERLRSVNDFFVNEYLVGLEDEWVLLSEVSREPGPGMGRDLPRGFVVPTPEERVELEFRLLPAGERRPEAIDHAFTSFAGYQGAHRRGDEIELGFGVSGVSFGTSYFPHSTFAENFEFWRTGGMIGRIRPVDRWWPFFQGWELFQEEIRRDMRIANAMGLEWIRIHYFNTPDFREDHLTTPAGRWMLEYLAFMAEVARETDQRLFLDFSLSPNDAALVAERFGDVIGVWEIQNEVLIIPGASEDRYDYWREVRNRIRAVRPDAVVLLTGGPQNYALYERLAQEGVVSDGVGQHAYVDGRDMADHFRDIAVSLGGYATRTGRLPVNSEYNWRMITRDTEEQQATRFAEISEHLLSQRSIPLLLQFQFQETFTVPPRTRGALRHYEPLRVDRTPKPQALVYTEMVRRYGRADNRLKQLSIDVGEIALEPGRPVRYTVRLRNLTGRTLEISASPALPAGFVSGGAGTRLRLEPGAERVLEREATPPAALAPGVYHLFEELRYDGRSHYGWGIARHREHPRLDLDAPRVAGARYLGGPAALNRVDLSSFSHVVFGEAAPALEVDWALYIYHSLRSATGADIRRATEATLSADQRAQGLILVGNAESNPLIAEIAGRLPAEARSLRTGEGMVLTMPNPFGGAGSLLLVTGGDPEGIQKAASDFVYRYWRHAKDAVSFREGMPPVEMPPVEGALHEPQAPPPAGAVVLEGPEEVARGQSFRVVVLDPSEPPQPAGHVALAARLDGTVVATATTNASGEAVFRLEAPGLYEIRPEGVEGQVIRVRVRP
jgi:hypothetical protein